jgi:LytS/YehU family sensor histidine kinase
MAEEVKKTFTEEVRSVKDTSDMTEEVKNTFTEEAISVKGTSDNMIAAVPGTIDATQAESRFIDPSNIDEAIIHAELINDAVDAEYVEVSAMPPVQSGIVTPETKDEVVYL